MKRILVGSGTFPPTPGVWAWVSRVVTRDGAMNVRINMTSKRRKPLPRRGR